MKWISTWTYLVAAIALAWLIPSLCLAAPYSIIDLGELDGTTYAGGSTGTAINSLGQVAGTSSFVLPGVPQISDTRNVFLHSENQMNDLGRLSYEIIRPAPLPPSVVRHDYPVVSAINNHGQVVGASNWAREQGWELPWQSPLAPSFAFYPQLPPPHSRTFLSSGGVMQDLGTLPGDHRSWALGISDDGTVIGVSQALSENVVVQHRSFVYSSGVMQEFGSLIDPSHGISNALAIDINANGKILAEGMVNDVRHAFTFDQGVVQDLGALATGVIFTHISDSGDYIAGTGPANAPIPPGSPHGMHRSLVLYNDGLTQTLDSFQQAIETLAGNLLFDGRVFDVSGVNSSGQVIGQASVTHPVLGGPIVPFVYSDGEIMLLPSLVDSMGWSPIAGDFTIPTYADLETVTDINDAGQMTGWGVNSNGRGRAFLMTPVPEPSSYVLLVCGVLGVAMSRIRHLRRRKR